jgi:hypothetical protein
VANEDPYPLTNPDVIPPEQIPTIAIDMSDGEQIPMEFILIAGGRVVIILSGIFVVKRKA